MPTPVFTSRDIAQLEQRGITLRQAESQLERFRTGFPQLKIVSPAAVRRHRGILRPSREQQQRYIALWQEYLREGHSVTKFVPASGAASRMFKDLYAYLDSGEETDFVRTFLDNIGRFAFGDRLKGKDGREAVHCLLEDMHYGELPKGLLLFHRYRYTSRTPAEEHLVEGALYAATQDRDGKTCRIHFTVSPQHLPLFRQHIAEQLPLYQKKYGVTYDISFSEQLPSTDTLAANPDGTPFRNPDGSLLFRPGGHGALIENLNRLDCDIAFIKNIDNVVPDYRKPSTTHYKQILAGVLIEEQRRVFSLLQDPNIPEEEKERLRRPIRVCGVVRNTGEPGGGPFIVREKDGTQSYQILESSQIADKKLMERSTHFNPVDLVCALRDENGKPYNLTRFTDPDTGFISHKSKDGRELLALELPGLWNGAMAKWNTIFVEVPVSTFNPVKTVNDLLRPEHQPKKN